MKKTLVALALAGLTCLGAVSTANAFSLSNGDTSFKLTGALSNSLVADQTSLNDKFGLDDTVTLDYKLDLKGALNDGFSYEFSTKKANLFTTSRFFNEKGGKFTDVTVYDIKKPKLVLKNANNTFQVGAVNDNFDAPVDDYTANALNGDKVVTSRGLYYGYSDDLNAYSVSYSFHPTSANEINSRLLSLNYLYNYSSDLSYEANLVVGNKTTDTLFQGTSLNNTTTLDLATKYSGVENLVVGVDAGLLYANVRSDLLMGSPADKYLRPSVSTQFDYTTMYVVPRLSLASNVTLNRGIKADNSVKTYSTYENIVGLSLFANKDNSPYLKAKHDKTKVSLFYTNDYMPSVDDLMMKSVVTNKVDFDVVVTGKDSIPYVVPTYKFSYDFINSKTGDAAFKATKNAISTSLKLVSNVEELNAYVTPSIENKSTYDFAAKSFSNTLTLTLDAPTLTVFSYYGDNSLTLDTELSYTLETTKAQNTKAKNNSSAEFDLTLNY